MKRVIGIVAEGPLDQITLKTVIDRITGESNIYRMIQPEQNARGEYGNGWKGVYRWCETNGALIPALFNQISPGLDVLIIHMDGDVSRKEKEVHCNCQSTWCGFSGKGSPLNCDILKRNECPVNLPCPNHEPNPNDYQQHLEGLLRHLLNNESQDERVIITVPCDSTDTWIVAAYDDLPEYENIADPWDKIISLKKRVSWHTDSGP